jgi:integrase
MSALGVQVDESFRVFAKRWWRSKQLGVDEDTINDYEWRLGYLQRFFGRFRLGEISPQLVDRFRDELHEQAETIRKAQERARTEKGRRPLMETVSDRRGRTYERRRRPLSNTSINAMISLLGQILQQAVDYELIDRNPVRVGGRSARFLRPTRPKRTFLEVDEFHAVLDAAGELEAEARRDFKGLGRRAMVASLGLAGLRISELMDLKVAQVDLTRGRFKLVDAKTEAGAREVEITLYLRDELLEYVMDRRARGLPHEPSDHFFGTSTGRRRDPDRFRDRILARAVERANANRQQTGLPPLPPDHAALAAADMGDVRGDDRPRPQVDRLADRPRQSSVHVLGLPAGRDPSLYRRAIDLDADAIRRRARRARSQPPDHPR